jgi:hypothetical protein
MVETEVSQKATASGPTVQMVTDSLKTLVICKTTMHSDTEDMMVIVLTLLNISKCSVCAIYVITQRAIVIRNAFPLSSVNHLTPNGHFSGRTAPLTYRCSIFLFIQQLYFLNILNMLHTIRFFLFKMSFIS